MFLVFVFLVPTNDLMFVKSSGHAIVFIFLDLFVAFKEAYPLISWRVLGFWDGAYFWFPAPSLSYVSFMGFLPFDHPLILDLSSGSIPLLVSHTLAL